MTRELAGQVADSIDAYALARNRVRETAETDPTFRMVLDEAAAAWQRVVDLVPTLRSVA